MAVTDPSSDIRTEIEFRMSLLRLVYPEAQSESRQMQELTGALAAPQPDPAV